MLKYLFWTTAGRLNAQAEVLGQKEGGCLLEAVAGGAGGAGGEVRGAGSGTYGWRAG